MSVKMNILTKIVNYYVSVSYKLAKILWKSHDVRKLS